MTAHFVFLLFFDTVRYSRNSCNDCGDLRSHNLLIGHECSLLVISVEYAGIVELEYFFCIPVVYVNIGQVFIIVDLFKRIIAHAITENIRHLSTCGGKGIVSEIAVLYNPLLNRIVNITLIPDISNSDFSIVSVRDKYWCV